MDPIFDFSAAPHLPFSLRDKTHDALRPELALAALSSVSQIGGKVVVLERNGELFIAVAEAA